ncbi:HAD family hydrolase [Bacillus sp. Marseille-P3661]|uniref:HAD family hydrolase n=1 Tax=Bacillus sp. Marseille-P3661 TaxID=1936234 RepID=UPI000C859407|nr:HAD family hydrolase [Bacillus sp. Marseille-P3661]
MNDYKLVFLDIDGTILKANHTIEVSTKNAISQLQEKGIEVVLATGRPLHNIKDLANELSITSFISYNGAHGIYQGEEIYREPVDHKDIEKFVEIANAHNHELVLYSDKENLFTSLETDLVQQFIKTFEMNLNQIFTFANIHSILGLTIITSEDKADTYYQDFEGIHYSNVNVTGLKNCLDVIRDNVNKGIAVQKLIERLGYSKENTIAFGDGMNDKEMLSAVGEGIAMGNAHPDLFQYAKHVTTDVENSGIYNGLKILGLVD